MVFSFSKKAIDQLNDQINWFDLLFVGLTIGPLVHGTNDADQFLTFFVSFIFILSYDL